MKSSRELIGEFHRLAATEPNYTGDKTSLYMKLDHIAEELGKITLQTYNQVCQSYREIRRDDLKELDIKLWKVLEAYISRYISDDPSSVKLLDVATGSGRDLIYATQLGYQVFGADNSSGFIRILSDLQELDLIPKGCCVQCDMRALPFDDATFDVVRHNASLLHLPLIAKGFSTDLAVSESNRVLKPGGLLYVYVKAGDSLELVDTGEGLGERVFQFFSHKTLDELFSRNGFTIIYASDDIELRNQETIEWITVIAQKD